jgi:hypothetical protein
MNDETIVRIQWNAGEAFDSPEQHAHDAHKLFEHAASWGAWAIGGSEAGRTDLRRSLERAAGRHRFELFLSRYGEWVALNTRFLSARHAGFEGPFIPGTRGPARDGGHAPRGIAWARGRDYRQQVGGWLTFGASHWLTQRAISSTGLSNDPIVAGTARFGRRCGAGGSKVFLMADTNEHDDQRDVFHGKPFTSLSGELGQHPATHGRDTEHGTRIDVIASWDDDKRVRGRRYDVLDDGDLQLAQDHFVLLGEYAIAHGGAA